MSLEVSRALKSGLRGDGLKDSPRLGYYFTTLSRFGGMFAAARHSHQSANVAKQRVRYYLVKSKRCHKKSQHWGVNAIYAAAAVGGAKAKLRGDDPERDKSGGDCK